MRIRTVFLTTLLFFCLAQKPALCSEVAETLNPNKSCDCFWQNEMERSGLTGIWRSLTGKNKNE